MNTLLIFFAFPIAVIIASVVMQKAIKNTVLVAALVFAIFLILTFTMFEDTFLVATLAYTILAFLTALITKMLCNNNEENSRICNCLNSFKNNISNEQNSSETSDIRTNIQNLRNDNNCFNYTYNRYKNF